MTTYTCGAIQRKEFSIPCLVTFLISLIAGILPAKGEYFKHLTLGDGLSQLSVMAITQDKLGRMWLGTREGVNVYDGIGITSYKGWVPQGADGNRVWIGNEVNSIANDSIGNLFIMIDDDIVKFDINADKFSRFTTNGNVRALAENNGEIVYVAGDSIFVKNKKDDEVAFAFTVPDAKQLTHLAVDNNHYYVSTPAGLHIYDRKRATDRVVLPSMNIFSSFMSHDGTLWITTFSHGLYRLGHDDAEPVRVSMPTAPEGVMGAAQCRNAIEDHSGKIWYGSFSGLFCFDPATGNTRHIKIPMNIGGLTHSSVFGMACDRKGNLWVGTYYGGVNYFSPDNDKFLNFNYDGFAPANLAHSFVKDLVVDRDGHLWFATDGAGVGCLDENWNIVTHLSTHSTKNTLRQNNIRCMEYDPAGNRLYIGTHLGGLSVFDIDRQTVTNLIDAPQYQTIPGNVIHELKLHDGNLFIASRTGLSWMDLATGVIKNVNSNIVATMFDIDREGNLYCTSASSRNLYKISNPTADKPVIETVAHSKSKLFPTQICTTDRGVLISTLGNGLLYYPYNDSIPRRINTTNSRLPNDYCYAISRGKNDDIYVTTEDHVVKIDVADMSMQTVNFSDFFPESHIINECALLSLADGDILVGSTKGITRLNDSDFNTSAVDEDAPGIYFSRLRLKDKDVTPSDGSGILQKALPYADHIVLPSNHNDFSIIIGVSDYLATTNVPLIEYRMDGVDSHWLTAPGNEIRYQNLPSGSYRLRARQPDGKEIALSVTVSTPWYNSWWGWLIYIAIAAAVGYFIIHKTLDAARLRLSLKKEQTERAQIEKVNQEKFVFFTNVSHEFQTPLTLIISHIDLLVARYKRHPKLIDSLMRVRAHSEQMSHLITQLLEFRKLQQNQQVLRVGLHDANELLQETATPFCDYAAKRGIEFTINPSDSNPRGAYDPALLNRVLVNILSNAFKYTPDGGKISCRVAVDSSGQVVFEVEDNGRGIAEKDLPYIFDRFYNGTAEELKRYNMDYRSTGIGLAFAKSIVDRHHGTINVKSREGIGTVFSVVIPCNLSVFADDSNVVIEQPSDHSLDAKPAKASLIPISTSEVRLPDSESAREKETSMPDADDTDSSTEESDRPLLLIVEDNPELRSNLTEFFSSYFRVEEARDGEEGLTKARELTPDIIISDVMMPRMSGTEMCRTIKADINLCHIPVILLTALSTSESKLEGLNTNADDYVTKPFESTLLLARVDNLLRLRRILRKQFDKQPVEEVDMSIVNPLDRDLLKRTTEIIEQHIDDLDFDIPMLCREVGVSRSLFFNKFKSLTGMTPNAFILNYRLKYAAALLTAQPHLSVTDVADRSGFATAIYFSRCFRKQFGVSPVNYRKGSTDTEATGNS